MALRREEMNQELTVAELDAARRYSVIVQYSPEDEAYIATVPELTGIASHGATASEAVEMAHEAAATWISVNREWNRAIPEPDIFK